jgi:hypothetical protein
MMLYLRRDLGDDQAIVEVVGPTARLASILIKGQTACFEESVFRIVISRLHGVALTLQCL